jgi:hypothetical protein
LFWRPRYYREVFVTKYQRTVKTEGNTYIVVRDKST